MTKKKTSAVNVDKIILDERCQTRPALSQEAVNDYADIYREEEVSLPALEVVDVDGKLVLIDGFHRLAGARQADHGFVRVTVVEECDLGRALWLASAVNQEHVGVRRSNLDKRQSVMLALKSQIGFEQSTRVLAEHVGVSHMTVSRVRAEFEAELRAKLEAAAEPDDPDAGVTKLQPDASSGQETPPADTSEAPADEPVPDTSTVEPPPLERSQALAEIADIASQLHKVAKKAHAEAERISAGAFPDLVELAHDVLAAAEALAAGAAAVRKEEEAERVVRKAS